MLKRLSVSLLLFLLLATGSFAQDKAVLPPMPAQETASTSSASATAKCSDAPQNAAAKKTLRLYSGPEQGFYDFVGQAIAKTVTQKSDYVLIACTSEGSIQNIRDLQALDARHDSDSAPDFGLVQSDVAFDAWHSEGDFVGDDFSSIHLVAPLFTEKMQIITAPHLYISSLRDLKGRRVWLGAPRSGTRMTARTVLLANGLADTDIENFNKSTNPCNLDDALQKLQAGQIQAVFQSSVAPNLKLYDLLNHSDIHVLGIDWSVVQQLEADGMYVGTSLQKEDYPRIATQVYTVGVQTLMLTKLPGEAGAVIKVAQVLSQETDSIEHELRTLLSRPASAASPSSQCLVKGAPTTNTGTRISDLATLPLLGVHPRSDLQAHMPDKLKEILWHYPIPRNAFRELAGATGLLWVTFLVFQLVTRIQKDRRRGDSVHQESKNFFIEHPHVGISVLVCGIIWLVGAVWLQIVEGDLNSQFRTLHGSAIALMENVLAKLQFPSEGIAKPTSPHGAEIMVWFSWVGFLLITWLVLPLIKRLAATSPIETVLKFFGTK